MKNIGLILPHDYKLLSVAAILEVFDTVNQFLAADGKPPAFDIQLISANATSQHLFGFPVIGLASQQVFDMILIPAFSSKNMAQTLQANTTCIAYIASQYQKGAGLATFCTGTFLLGASGLLNGRVATTHVDASQVFTTAFPLVKLQPNKTVTQDGRLYTSGGATSSFHLLLHLINEHCGKAMAIRMAKLFAIDMDRECQSYFGSFQPTKNHRDELVAIAQQKIEERYQEATTLDEIIKDLPASRRNMVRRFKQITGITPIEYLQQTRIEVAKRLLETTAQQMTEIIYNTGYTDPKAFRKVFKKNVGMTPTQYREKFAGVM